MVTFSLAVVALAVVLGHTAVGLENLGVVPHGLRTRRAPQRRRYRRDRRGASVLEATGLPHARTGPAARPGGQLGGGQPATPRPSRGARLFRGLPGGRLAGGRASRACITAPRSMASRASCPSSGTGRPSYYHPEGPLGATYYSGWPRRTRPAGRRRRARRGHDRRVCRAGRVVDLLRDRSAGGADRAGHALFHVPGRCTEPASRRARRRATLPGPRLDEPVRHSGGRRVQLGRLPDTPAHSRSGAHFTSTGSRPAGLLVPHLSNRYIDFGPVVARAGCRRRTGCPDMWARADARGDVPGRAGLGLAAWWREARATWGRSRDIGAGSRPGPRRAHCGPTTIPTCSAGFISSGRAEHVQDEGVLEGDLAERVVAAGGAGMAGAHVGAGAGADCRRSCGPAGGRSISRVPSTPPAGRLSPVVTSMCG